MAVKVLPIPALGRSIYVEVEEVDVVVAGVGTVGDLPDEAEPVGMRDRIFDAFQALQDNIIALAGAVHESLNNNPPEEWSLELNIGFKGTVTPVPVVLSSAGQGGIKVTARWKKSSGSA